MVAVVALGANLHQPEEQLRSALSALDQIAGIKLVSVSAFFCTKPVGYANQPDFVNAVALMRTTLSARLLLQTLQAVEQQFGRMRTFRNAPRTLDLDIIDYDHQSVDDSDLQLPHPRAHERAFVMVPLADIAPDYSIGRHGCAADLAARLRRCCPEQGISRLS